ncbi:hypothetical protein CR205_00415 [Alteribacter lacisalsi]|uniref:Uncharacterized protein n=1 Tax=Alteribacter lacisalsi TaxID=2045244 RepID=A0A2W0H8N7_9BACI|nr:hypothetical protein [Alteribacter lacisalsi]PYZ97106.1 hypothetical protein CR205_00415 [Alteribacter lacisalsi]
MSTKKKIYFLTGAVLLLALTILLSYFYSQDDFNQPVPADLADPDENEESADLTTSEEEPGDLNITTEDEDSEDMMGNGEMTSDEGELSEAFDEASEETNLLSTDAGSPGEQTYYNHYWFAHEYTHRLEPSPMEADERQEDARFQARELMTWKELAARDYGWDYSEEAFQQFIENEDVLEDDDTAHLHALSTLRSESGNHYLRYSETRFLKRFILQQIQPELESELPREDGEDDEDYEYRLFRYFIQHVMEEME